MSYTYVDPIDKGYKEIKISKKKHNEFFPKRKITFKSSLYIVYKYYISDYGILIYKFTSKFGIILNLILFPIVVLMGGLENIKEIIIDYKKLLNEKKYGTFVSDHLSSKNDIYIKVKNYINEK